MARRLESAGVEVLHALGPRRSYDPHARANLARLDSADPDRKGGVSARNAWPLRAEEHWSYYQTNDVCHATYWIAEWPRIDVGPDFLAPLLVQTRSQRTVAVTMEPVPPLKAMLRPLALYGKETTGPNMLVIGQIGYAKSSLVNKGNVPVAADALRPDRLGDRHQG